MNATLRQGQVCRHLPFQADQVRNRGRIPFQKQYPDFVVVDNLHAEAPIVGSYNLKIRTG